jgi:hypothetical protein
LLSLNILVSIPFIKKYFKLILGTLATIQWVKIKLHQQASVELSTIELHEEFVILQQAPANFIVQWFYL